LPARAPTDWKADAMQRRIRRRYGAERRFRLLGLLAVLLSAAFLAFLLGNMLIKGLGGFSQTELRLTVDFPRSGLTIDPAAVTGEQADDVLAAADIDGAVRRAASAQYGRKGPAFLSEGAWLRVRERIKDDPSILRRTETLWLPASSKLDSAAKGAAEERDEADYSRLSQAGAVKTGFNARFLSGADATDPTVAGIWGAFKGSLLTMLVTLALAFPIGVLSAVYLEEYAPRNRWTDIIEVSINNLAAVPSIIFGLLGLAVFLNFMNLPRSAPLVGGLTLALMTMPVIVIAGRNAIKSVPPVDPRRGARHRREPRPGRLPPRPAARSARHPHRHDHRHGARAGRNRAAPDDRHARLRRLAARWLHRSVLGAPRADLPLVGRGQPRLRREDQRRHHRAAGLPARDERPRHLPPQQIRTALVNHGNQ
jgi:phosphate transport system permease protein